MFEGALNTPYLHRFLDEAKARLAKVDPSGPLPDRYVQSNYEAMNALKIGIEKSKFEGRKDTMKLIEALEGLEMKEGDDFPQGDKTLRKEDHQAFLREFIFEVKGGTYKLLETVSKDKTIVPAGLQVPRCVSERGTGYRRTLPGEQPGGGVGSCATDRNADRPFRRAGGA